MIGSLTVGIPPPHGPFDLVVDRGYERCSKRGEELSTWRRSSSRKSSRLTIATARSRTNIRPIGATLECAPNRARPGSG